MFPVDLLSQMPGMATTLGPSATVTKESSTGSDILSSDKYNMVLDKSNIIMLGPTGSGN